jgi:hypothetical protein
LDLRLQNKGLLAKWLVNLLNTEGLWQTLLANKYLRSKSLTQVKAKPFDSHSWRGLMKIKDEVFSNGSFSIKDGSKTRFWDDTWVGVMPFKDRYSSLFNIVRDPHVTVAKVLSTQPLNISFRRALVDNNLVEWHDLVALISNVTLVEGSDFFIWNLTKTSSYMVRSFYLYMLSSQPLFRHKLIWKLKFLWKLRFFFGSFKEVSSIKLI